MTGIPNSACWLPDICSSDSSGNLASGLHGAPEQVKTMHSFSNVVVLSGGMFMRSSFGNPEAVATEIGGHFRPGKDRIVQTLVGPVCKAIWPEKTDANVAAVCGCDPRNARRYMSGELPIPAILLVAINTQLVRRLV